MSEPSTIETRLAHCPSCSREIPDTESPIRCSYPLGCSEFAYSCCDEFERCMDCGAIVCAGGHGLQYQDGVRCRSCFDVELRRLGRLRRAISEIIYAAREPRDYAEQDGRKWRGFIDCETVLEGLMRGIEDGTLAPEVKD